jgi:hypothetical protein
VLGRRKPGPAPSPETSSLRADNYMVGGTKTRFLPSFVAQQSRLLFSTSNSEQILRAHQIRNMMAWSSSHPHPSTESGTQ